MNLVVASRHNDRHVRFDVEGRWANGDALKLAYMVKAAVARIRNDQVLDRGFVGVSFSGGVSMQAVVSQGCRPIGARIRAVSHVCDNPA